MDIGEQERRIEVVPDETEAPAPHEKNPQEQEPEKVPA